MADAFAAEDGTQPYGAQLPPPLQLGDRPRRLATMSALPRGLAVVRPSRLLLVDPDAKPCIEEELVARVGSALKRHARRGSKPPPALAGSTAMLPLTEVVRLIEARRSSGILSITTAHGGGYAYFELGALAHAAYAGMIGVEAFTAMLDHGPTQFELGAELPVRTPNTIGRHASQLMPAVRVADAVGPRHTLAPVDIRENPRRRATPQIAALRDGVSVFAGVPHDSAVPLRERIAHALLAGAGPCVDPTRPPSGRERSSGVYAATRGDELTPDSRSGSRSA